MSDQTSARDGRARSICSGATGANDVKGPLHWPTLSPLDAQREWPALRAWVDDLRERYPEDLDHHAIPSCWFAHESHVVALQALRDHERISFDQSSPASSAVDWHRALRDIAALLRSFSANLRCTNSEHIPSRSVPPTDEDAFAQFVTEQLAQRRRAVIANVLEGTGADPPMRG